MLLAEFKNRLKSAKNFEEINDALQKYLLTFHIKTFAFTYYFHYPSSKYKPKYDFSSSNFLGWHKHYIEEGYEDIDTTLHEVYKTTLPVFWNLKQQLKMAKSKREKQMRLDSIKFGIEQGVCIPVHGSNDDFAVLLIVQMQGEYCLNNWEDFQHEVFSAAYQYHFYLKKLLIQHVPDSTFQLNQREFQCLLLTAKQYSAKQVSEELGITERTVNYHIQRLNKKLGAKYKHEALLKAIQRGLIKV